MYGNEFFFFKCCSYISTYLIKPNKGLRKEKIGLEFFLHVSQLDNAGLRIYVIQNGSPSTIRRFGIISFYLISIPVKLGLNAHLQCLLVPDLI